ncbi:MAG: hypothetical protein ACHQIG_09760 [Acidimicrobiia bacterium]
MAARRFPIRFNRVNQAMALLGIVPSRCRVDLDEAQLHVHLGWAFRLHAPLADVRAVAPDHGPVWGWGAHGWRGTWLVNGSSSGLVRIELDPPGHGHTMGIPVLVRVLRVSVDDPDGLIGELGVPASGRE